MSNLKPAETKKNITINYKQTGLCKDRFIHLLVLFCASAGIISVVLMTIFMLQKGVTFFGQYSAWDFIFGQVWQPNNDKFGILPFIFSSFAVTLTAIAISLPISLGCSLTLAEYAPRKVASKVRPLIELLAGIPSVIFGFFGMMVIVPFLRSTFGGSGYSLLGASTILAIMILPTLVNISEDSLRAVPKDFREASLALGATKWQTIKSVVLPNAKSGIWAAIILGIGRAIGETMAVIMVVGNATNMPGSVLEPGRTLTGNIALEMAYASGIHQQALFATGIVLFIFILIINSTVRLRRKGESS